MRATKSDLLRRLEMLSGMMQTSLDLDKNSEGYRVECDGGSRQLSPRMGISDTLRWIDVGIAVLSNLSRGTGRDDTSKIARCNHLEQSTSLRRQVVRQCTRAPHGPDTNHVMGSWRLP